MSKNEFEWIRWELLQATKRSMAIGDAIGAYIHSRMLARFTMDTRPEEASTAVLDLPRAA